jgi:hypothetical protein
MASVMRYLECTAKPRLQLEAYAMACEQAGEQHGLQCGYMCVLSLQRTPCHYTPPAAVSDTNCGCDAAPLP